MYKMCLMYKFWKTVYLKKVYFYDKNMNEIFVLCTDKKKCIAWMHCKSLWIKASAKCINVNVLCYFYF